MEIVFNNNQTATTVTTNTVTTAAATNAALDLWSLLLATSSSSSTSASFSRAKSSSSPLLSSSSIIPAVETIKNDAVNIMTDAESMVVVSKPTISTNSTIFGTKTTSVQDTSLSLPSASLSDYLTTIVSTNNSILNCLVNILKPYHITDINTNPSTNPSTNAYTNPNTNSAINKTIIDPIVNDVINTVDSHYHQQPYHHQFLKTLHHHHNNVNDYNHPQEQQQSNFNHHHLNPQQHQQYNHRDHNHYHHYLYNNNYFIEQNDDQSSSSSGSTIIIGPSISSSLSSSLLSSSSSLLTSSLSTTTTTTTTSAATAVAAVAVAAAESLNHNHNQNLQHQNQQINHLNNNNNNNDYDYLNELLKEKFNDATVIISVIILVLINIIVIFGNILVILSVFVSSKLRTVTNFFIVSLAVADFLVGICVLPYSLTFEILDTWIFGEVWCQGWLVIDVWMCTASILNLCAISVDRYMAVTRPVRYRSLMTAKRAKFIIAGVWIISFIICFPPLLIGKQESFSTTSSAHSIQEHQQDKTTASNLNTTTADLNMNILDGNNPFPLPPISSTTSNNIIDPFETYHPLETKNSGSSSISSNSKTSNKVSSSTTTANSDIDDYNDFNDDIVDVDDLVLDDLTSTQHHHHRHNLNNFDISTSSSDFASTTRSKSAAPSLSKPQTLSSSSSSAASLPSSSTPLPASISLSNNNNNNNQQQNQQQRKPQPVQCALFRDKSYVIYSALGSFFIPMFVMIFFYWRIYLVAIRTSRALKRGYRITKTSGTSGIGLGNNEQGGNIGENNQERLTLRIHRGYGGDDNTTNTSTTTSGTDKRPSLIDEEHQQQSLQHKDSQKNLTTSDSQPKSRPSWTIFHRSSNQTETALTTTTTRARTSSNTLPDSNTNPPSSTNTPNKLLLPPGGGGSGVAGASTPSGGNSVNGRNHRNSSSTFQNVSIPFFSSPSSSREGSGKGSGKHHGAGGTGGGGANVPPRPSKRASKYQAKRFHAETKAAKTVGIIVGGFIVCWLPFFTVYLTRAFCGDCIPELLFSIFFWLGYCNSMINPCIYGLFSRDFRRAFKNIICRCSLREETSVSSLIRQIHMPTFFEDMPEDVMVKQESQDY